jgi:hypothetical protein
VIKNSEFKSDANNNNKGCSHNPKLSTQPHDGFSVADFLIEDKTEGNKNAISLELFNRPES